LQRAAKIEEREIEKGRKQEKGRGRCGGYKKIIDGLEKENKEYGSGMKWSWLWLWGRARVEYRRMMVKWKEVGTRIRRNGTYICVWYIH